MAFVSGGKRPADLAAAFVLQQQQQHQQQQQQQQPQRSTEEDAARLLMEMNAQQQQPGVVSDARAPTPRMQAMTGHNVGLLGPTALNIPYSFLAAAQQQQQQPTQSSFSAVTHPSLAAAMLNPQAQAAFAAAQGQQQAQAQQAAQLQLLSQLLLNPALQGGQQQVAAHLNASHIAQLLNPATANAMALYYGQLAAIIQQQQQQQVQAVQQAAHIASAVANQQQPKAQPSHQEQALLLQQAQAQAAAAVAAANGGRQIAQDMRQLPPVQTTLANGNVLQRPLGPMASPEAVKDHISRLISENEAILEPNPVLLKRRPYHRQPVGPQNSVNPLMDQGSSSQCNSPGFPTVVNAVREKTPATRSQSLFEPFLPHQHERLLQDGARGSLTSGQPVKGPEKALMCNYCQVKFPNEAGLHGHEYRCSRRTEGLLMTSRAGGSSVPTESLLAVAQSPAASEGGRKTSDVVSPHNGPDNRHPLKKRLLAVAAAEALHEEELRKAKIARLELSTPPVSAPNSPAKRNSVGSIEHLQPAAAAAMLAQLGQHNRQDAAMSSRRPSMPTAMPRPQPLPPAVLLQASAAKTIPSVAAMAAVLAAQQAKQPALALTSSVMQPTVTLNSTELNLTFKPYCLTLTQSSTSPTTADTAASSPKVRNRPRHITMETFVCLKRPQPMFVQQKERLSMYSNWQQLPVNPLEAKLNLLWMGTCSTKARRGVKPYWRYTTANKELGVLRMTHSSFWEISNKMRRQTQALLTQQLSTAVVSSSASTSSTTSVNDAHEQRTSSGGVKSEPNFGDDNVDVETVAPSTAAEITLPAVPRKSVRTNVPPVATMKEESAETPRGMPKKTICSGGYRTDDVYVYVRGRGRGRYVCERCGIRCKKPSMLKKHIRSHTDVRPFKCQRCNFSFKTKGNLTKHLQSKSHRRRLADLNGTLDSGAHDSDSENDRLEIASPAPSDETNSIDDMESDCSTDNEEESKAKEIFSPILSVPYRQYGQENTLLERTSHTPPTLWYCRTVSEHWPFVDRTRSCHSAPPAAHVSPDARRRRRRHSRTRKVTDAGRSTPSTPFDDTDSHKNSDAAQLPSSSTQSKATTAAADANVSNGGAAMPNQLSAWMAQDRQTHCETCGREFRKAGDLSIHRQTHIFAKQSQSRSRYLYPCPHCNLQMRSKPLLHKHLHTTHPNAALPDGWDERPMPREDQQSSSDADDKADVRGVPTTSPLANGRGNPRPFVCTDCDTGFRIHGHLAKHLRSKMHVMKLESQDKLPEGAFHLFETNSASLNDIDTTDCNRARISLLALFQSLASADQQKPPSSDPTVELICAEEMLAPSPAPETPRKRCESLSVKTLETTPRRRCESISVAMVTPTKEPKVEQVAVDDEVPTPAALNNKAVTANVWVPPKADHVAESKRPSSVEINGTLAATKLLLDAAAAADRVGYKGGSGEDASDPRSETSTPNHKISTSSSTGAAGGSMRPTQCRFCDAYFETPNELEVHLHADHIVMRDGNDFKCPRKHCDKVYPNRENLRHHIAAHYHGGGANPSDGREEHRDATMAPVADVSPETMVALHRKLTGTSSNHIASAPGHSPGAPEESHTTRQKSVKTHLVKLNTIPECTGPLNTSPSADFKSPPSLNNSPLSIGGESSDSRNSSRQSASPIGGAPSLSNGLGNPGRLLMKRKSVDELASPSKRPATSTPPGQRCSSTVSVDMTRSLSTPTVLAQRASPTLQRQQQAQLAQWLVATQACMPGGQQSMLATYLMQMQQLSSISHHPPLEAQASTMSDVSQSSSDGSPLTTAASPSSNGVGQLPCAICSKVFDNALTLQQHWLTHVCDRPHVCTLCDAGFTNSDALNAHIATHQSQTNSA